MNFYQFFSILSENSMNPELTVQERLSKQTFDKVKSYLSVFKEEMEEMEKKAKELIQRIQYSNSRKEGNDLIWAVRDTIKNFNKFISYYSKLAPVIERRLSKQIAKFDQQPNANNFEIPTRSNLPIRTDREVSLWWSFREHLFHMQSLLSKMDINTAIWMLQGSSEVSELAKKLKDVYMPFLRSWKVLFDYTKDTYEEIRYKNDGIPTVPQQKTDYVGWMRNVIKSRNDLSNVARAGMDAVSNQKTNIPDEILQQQKTKIPKPNSDHEKTRVRGR